MSTPTQQPQPDPPPAAVGSGPVRSGPAMGTDHGGSATVALVSEQGGPEELAAVEDRWRRAAADLENLRKRSQREVETARAAERSHVVAEFLPVVDNLELALQHADADPGSIVAGVAAVRDQALATLARLGFTRIEDTGARFDPARHEAARVVSDSDAEPGAVAAVLRPGYDGPAGLLRPAMVAVTQRPPTPNTGPDRAAQPESAQPGSG